MSDLDETTCPMCEDLQDRLQKTITQLRQLDEPLKKDFPLSVLTFEERTEERDRLLSKRDGIVDEIARHQKIDHLEERPEDERTQRLSELYKEEF